MVEDLVVRLAPSMLVVLIRPQSWQRHGLKPWIEAAKKRLHHNVLAIALANKLARIAWRQDQRQAFRAANRDGSLLADGGRAGLSSDPAAARRNEADERHRQRTIQSP